MLRKPMLILASTGIAMSAATTALSAQIRGSEAASVSQTVDGTVITVAYSRPVARGRTLFGEVVAWNEPWTGANWATTLEVSKDIRLNGTEVPAGKYSVWITPRAQAPWTVSLNRNAKLFHFQKPDSTADAIHIVARPEAAAHVEMLTWSFPAVTGDAASLQMQWGNTALPLQVVVQPTKPVALAADVRRTYVGTYDLAVHVPAEGWQERATLEVFEEGNMLRGKIPFPIHPGDELVFDLVPAGTHRFSPGLYRDGKLFNIEMAVTFEFQVPAGGKANGVLVRGIEGTLFAEGGTGR